MLKRFAHGQKHRISTICGEDNGLCQSPSLLGQEELGSGYEIAIVRDPVFLRTCMEDMELMNIFHDSKNNALLRLGKAEISLKETQFEALKAFVMERKDSLVILPTGYGKSLIYQTN